MSDILADYREWRDQQTARVSTHSDGCHMWHKDCMIHRLAAEVERLRLVICNKISELGQEMERPRISLTDAERESIELAAGDYLYHQDAGGRSQHIRQTLLGLLERLT
jgi:hypothetical protein